MTRKRDSKPPFLKLVPSTNPASDGRRQFASSDPVPDVGWTILMARAQDGDRIAYLGLLEAMTPYLRSIASRWYSDRSDIEDAVQDVLLTVHSIRHTYDPTRPFGPWLYAIANRRFIDRLRRQTRLRQNETPLKPEHETFSEYEANLADRFEALNLESAISKLPPAQQQAVRLLRLKEMSLKEAADVSGMSIVSLKVAMHRAIKTLRRILTDGN
jgi:RNA polymerase sigma factor (sigma-70 family)